MKISRVEIQNFKAFWHTQSFDIENKNILVFGTNGSGKSSLYHSLHAFVQSSIKSDEERQKYFVFDGDESLLNIHAPQTLPSFVRITTELGHIYEFSPTLSQPFHRPSTDDVIKLANESSDFMNYRFMLAFSSFRNSQKADIFPIIRNEFFPFWTNEAGVNYQTWYDSLLTGIIQQKELYDSATTFAKRRFWSGPFKAYKEQLTKFNSELETKFLSYLETINDLMRDHFLHGDNIKLYHDPQSFKHLQVSTGSTWELKEPELVLRITKNNKTIPKPHVFLNEARLTGIALSMRMAIFDQRYRGAGDFKILVLDDLLLSLDMGKRMEVINYVLTNDKFANYQLFIFTHDKGFYNVLRNNLIRSEEDWKCFEFYENNNPTEYRNPIVVEKVDSLKKAEQLLGDDSATPPIPPKYDECALYLRKKAEELIRTFYDPSLENLSRYEVLEKLANSLGAFEKEFNGRIRGLFTAMIDDDNLLTAEIVQRLSSDPYINASLSREEIGKTNNLKFKVFRVVSEFQKYRTEIKTHRENLVKKCKEVDELRDRILNHGAHPTAEPLFAGELAAGVETMTQLQQRVRDYLQWFKDFERDVLKKI